MRARTKPLRRMTKEQRDACEYLADSADGVVHYWAEGDLAWWVSELHSAVDWLDEVDPKAKAVPESCADMRRSARLVVDSWEEGDLAGAVSVMSGDLPQARADLGMGPGLSGRSNPTRPVKEWPFFRPVWEVESTHTYAGQRLKRWTAEFTDLYPHTLIADEKFPGVFSWEFRLAGRFDDHGPAESIADAKKKAEFATGLWHQDDPEMWHGKAKTSEETRAPGENPMMSSRLVEVTSKMFGTSMQANPEGASFYGILFGQNPFAPYLWAVLGLDEYSVPRFRDIHVDGDHIVLLTRAGGGGQREEYESDIEALRRHPSYVSDEDEDFDPTYASFRFTIPEAHREMVDAVRELAEAKAPAERWMEFLARARTEEDDPEVRRATEKLRPTLEALFGTRRRSRGRRAARGFSNPVDIPEGRGHMTAATFEFGRGKGYGDVDRWFGMVGIGNPQVLAGVSDAEIREFEEELAALQKLAETDRWEAYDEARADLGERAVDMLGRVLAASPDLPYGISAQGVDGFQRRRAELKRHAEEIERTGRIELYRDLDEERASLGETAVMHLGSIIEAQRTLEGTHDDRRQLYEYLLITALEGGSNYWYLLPDLSMIPKPTPRPSVSESIFHEVWQEGKIVPVIDKEDEHPLGNITRANIEKAWDLMRKKQPWNFRDILIDWDADTADVWFQFVVMGELVYG